MRRAVRLLDFLIAFVCLFLGSPVLALIFLCSWIDTGSALFFQERIGIRGETFYMVKFRTMHTSTASMATHLVDTSKITLFGYFLRCSKLDELPQLWNVIKGEMSLVGPRPCLPSQIELIHERSKRGVLDAAPGMTGLSQIRSIDMSNPVLLAETDAEMLRDMSLLNYVSLIGLTLIGWGFGDRVRLR